MRFISICFVAFVFVSCAKKPIIEEHTQEQIQSSDTKAIIHDLESFEQNALPYLKNIDIKNTSIEQDSFYDSYFRVWNSIPSDSKEATMWPFNVYTYGKMYGENLKPIEGEFFEKLRENANFKDYKSLNKTAITLDHLDIRAFPTSLPMFRDPSIAGEGFPFDYVQNSTISANKPVLISHYSKDRAWVFIFTSFASGWVKSKDIVTIDEKYTKEWQKAKQIFLTADDKPLYDESGTFLFNSRVGMLLPLVDEDEKYYTVLTISRYKGNQPNYHKTKIDKSLAHKEVMSFTKQNIQAIFDEVAKSKYGWGGMYGQRDCSSTIRDIYTPFGVWLPRNSYQQSKIGNIISLENLSDDEKIELIKDKAIPFKTILYKKGHVLIYVGVRDGEVVAYHNTWGIKTMDKNDQEDRVIVGKTIYSSLKLGQYQDNYDEEGEILKNLVSMNIIPN
jgi:hypothetical protein